MWMRVKARPMDLQMPGSGPRFGHAVTRATSMTNHRRDKGCSSSMARPTRPAPRRTVLATSVITMLLALSGCSGSSKPSDENGSSSGSQPGQPPLTTHTTMGVVSGKLADDRRSRLKKRIATVVDDWFDAAYVGGEWPRSDFDQAYPHFSARAARDARRDSALMSNARYADRLESVEATKRRLRIDVLAVHHRAAGVTARFVLTMKLAGEVNRAERVAGSLFLTWRGGGWRVFGYDVQRGMA